MNKVIRIAIADDFPALVTGLKLILSSHTNCQVVIEAYNGFDLLNKIRASVLKPNICLLDINMPIMNGYETLNILKEEHPEIKTIILSSHFNEYTIIKTLRDGASACLPKEIDDIELQKAIEQVLSKGFYHCDIVSEFIPELVTGSFTAKLTDKEVDFLHHVCTDMNYAEIAKEMQVSPRTVDGYRDNLFEKLNVRSRSALAVFAIQSGLYRNKALPRTV